MPMIFLQTLVYLTHVYIYSVFFNLVPHITTFWEWHSLVTTLIMISVVTYAFIKNIFHNISDFRDAAIELADDFDAFKERKTKKKL
jgi:peptidoglycan/LPS O-acetylase OafA/YrhL